MASIVALKTERNSTNEAAIDLLQDLLDQAKAGEVVAVGVAIVRPGMHINCGFTDFDTAGMLLGAVALLQSRVMANTIDV